MELDGKIALVTGASRGIGSAIATKLGEKGATVIATATTEEGVAKINAQFNKLGLKGGGVLLDVTDKKSIGETLSHIRTSYGPLTILVNNAAITRDNLFLRMKDAEWHRVLDTNLNAVFTLTQASLRDMLKEKWGRIINIGSVVGSIGNPGQVNYAAAKAALVGATKSLAHEIASRNITVNVIAPGFIHTDMTNVLPEEQKRNLLATIPMQRLGEPQDIAAVAAFLASNQAAYITGQTIHVNGGMFMA